MNRVFLKWKPSFVSFAGLKNASYDTKTQYSRLYFSIFFQNIKGFLENLQPHRGFRIKTPLLISGKDISMKLFSLAERTSNLTAKKSIKIEDTMPGYASFKRSASADAVYTETHGIMHSLTWKSNQKNTGNQRNNGYGR